MTSGLTLESKAVLIGDASGPATADLVRLFRSTGADVYVTAAEDPRLDATWIAVDGWGPAAGFEAVGQQHETLHSLITIVDGPSTEPRSMSDRAFDIVDAIRESTRRFGEAPRHVVVMHCEREPKDSFGSRMLKTLTGYLSAHLSGERTHINLVSHSATPLGYQRAAQCALALCSGWLDAMNGQQIEVRGLE